MESWNFGAEKNIRSHLASYFPFTDDSVELQKD